MSGLTVRQFFKLFPDDAACLEHLFRVRFGRDYVCPDCQRPGRWYPLAKRRAYTCQWCGHHAYPCVGTPFARSRTSLQLWFYAIYLFTTSRHGVAAKELERQLGVTYKAAWRMAHEIREHMAAVDGDPPLSGVIEADEVMVGGHRPGKRGRGAAGKTVVFGMLERGGDVLAKVVPNVRKRTLQPIIEANVTKGSTIHTDELASYDGLAGKGYEHETVNHGAGEFADGDCHVNTLEGYWARLKLSVRGTHVHVSGKHLQKYVGEFEYRHNSRERPEEMLPELLTTFPSSGE